MPDFAGGAAPGEFNRLRSAVRGDPADRQSAALRRDRSLPSTTYRIRYVRVRCTAPVRTRRVLSCSAAPAATDWALQDLNLRPPACRAGALAN